MSLSLPTGNPLQPCEPYTLAPLKSQSFPERALCLKASLCELALDSLIPGALPLSACWLVPIRTSQAGVNSFWCVSMIFYAFTVALTMLTLNYVSCVIQQAP